MRKKRTTGYYERFMAMSDAQRDAEVAEFDREWTGDFLPGKVMGVKDVALHQRAAAVARRGRPRVGRGAKRVLISIEQDLLTRTDALARRKKLSRSQLIAQSLLAALKSAKTRRKAS